MSEESRTIYKIFRLAEWESFQREERFIGSPDDLEDGFIHLSAAEQLHGTAEKHFGGEDEIVVAAIDAIALGDALKWEVSRGGMLFPHLYAPLAMASVLSAVHVARDANGGFQFPDDIP